MKHVRKLKTVKGVKKTIPLPLTVKKNKADVDTSDVNKASSNNQCNNEKNSIQQNLDAHIIKYTGCEEINLLINQKLSTCTADKSNTERELAVCKAKNTELESANTNLTSKSKQTATDLSVAQLGYENLDMTEDNKILLRNNINNKIKCVLRDSASKCTEPSCKDLVYCNNEKVGGTDGFMVTYYKNNEQSHACVINQDNNSWCQKGDNYKGWAPNLGDRLTMTLIEGLQTGNCISAAKLGGLNDNIDTARHYYCLL